MKPKNFSLPLSKFSSKAPAAIKLLKCIEPSQIKNIHYFTELKLKFLNAEILSCSEYSYGLLIPLSGESDCGRKNP